MKNKIRFGLAFAAVLLVLVGATASAQVTIKEFPIPTASFPVGIVGFDRNLWFTESGNIGRITREGCGPQKLHPTVFRPHITLLHPDRLVTRLSFLLLKVADFKGVQGR